MNGMWEKSEENSVSLHLQSVQKSSVDILHNILFCLPQMGE